MAYDMMRPATTDEQKGGQASLTKLRRFKETIKSYKREFEKWEARGKKIVKRYRDERNTIEGRGKKYNILYSNIENLKPACYARPPKVQVDRRWKDSDPIGRLASQIAERVGEFQVEHSNLDSVLRSSVVDLLLPARASSWCRYEKEEAVDPMTGMPFIVSEKVQVDYVHWLDYGHNDARTYEDVHERWRVVYLTRGEVEARFGAQALETVSFDFCPQSILEEESKKSEETQESNKAKIYEYWCEYDKTAYWFQDNSESFLDEKRDPLGLEHFFPSPKPLYGSLTTESLIPIPDFAQYQDQARELDEVTSRKSKLLKALKVAGVYDASLEGLQRLLKEDTENKLIPIKDWPQFAQGGGLKGAVDFLPLADVVNALIQLNEASARIIQEIYDISGMPDIVRGSTDPRETLGAQQLKGQHASIRMQDRRQAVDNYVLEIVRTMLEIAFEQFSPQTIYDMSGAQFLGIQSPEDQVFLQAIQLLRDDKFRSFRLDIETDSTVFADDSQAKQDSNELLQAIGGTFAQLGPVIQMMPSLTGMLGEILLFIVRKYRAGRGLEQMIEQSIAQMQQEQQQQAQQPAPPDPEMMKMAQEQADRREAMDLKREEIAVKRDAIAADREKAAMQLDIQAMKQNTEFRINKLETDLKQQVAFLSHEKDSAKLLIEAHGKTIEQIKQPKESQPKESPSPNITLVMPTGKKRVMFGNDPVTGQRMADLIPMDE